MFPHLSLSQNPFLLPPPPPPKPFHPQRDAHGARHRTHPRPPHLLQPRRELPRALLWGRANQGMEPWSFAVLSLAARSLLPFANSISLPLAQVWDAVRGRLQTEFADIPSVEVGAVAESKRGHLALDYTCMKWVQLSDKVRETRILAIAIWRCVGMCRYHLLEFSS
jgi:hypothetical protein